VSLPVRFAVLRGLLKEIGVATRDERPIVVGGARELAGVLRRELSRGASPGAVRTDDSPRGAAVLVYMLGHEPSADDDLALSRARRARVPVVAVTGDDVDSVPHVLATDIVRVRAGEGFPVDRIARAIAGRLGEDAAPLAARVPVLRRAVADHLVARFSRRNGIVAAAVFIPGVDMPLLTLNELRMLLRIEQAYGLDVDLRERVPEIVATFGAGFVLRALARELLDLVPTAGWAVKGAVAYAGTRAMGEAARARLQWAQAPERAPEGDSASRPPPGEASPAVP
jgi:uncharacterized protein (DUF697 family)